MYIDLPVFNNQLPIINIVQKVEQKPQPQYYTIKKGDTLTKIAEAHTTSVERLWAANPELSNPDLIEPEKPLKIPENGEVLPERPLPATLEVFKDNEYRTSAPSGRSSVSGNTYSYGYCTWYVKNMRPDIPNGLGNANAWYYNYQGAKGSEPAVGAVGVAKGYTHVVIITSVNDDGTVGVSEMNYAGWNVVSSRTAPALEFLYIY